MSKSENPSQEPIKPAAKKFAFAYTQKAKPVAKKPKVETPAPVPASAPPAEVTEPTPAPSQPTVDELPPPCLLLPSDEKQFDNSIRSPHTISSPSPQKIKEAPEPVTATSPSPFPTPAITITSPRSQLVEVAASPSKVPPASPPSSGQTNKKFNFAYTSHQKPTNKKANTNTNEYEIVDLDDDVSTSSRRSLFQSRTWTPRTNIPKPESLPDPNEIDPSTTRLRDLFYIIPTKYPAPKYRQEREAKREEERKRRLEMKKGSKTSASEGSQADDCLSQHSKNSDVSIEVKQVQPEVDNNDLELEVDEEGNIVIRQECLLKAHKQTDVVDDRRFVEGETTKANYFSFRRKPVLPNSPWKVDEMIRFYYVLSTVGTDFGMMSRLIPGRSREQIHMKYKAEVKRNPHLIDHVFRHPKKFNLKIFSDQEYLQSELADKVRSAHGSASTRKRRRSLDTSNSVTHSAQSKQEDIARLHELAEKAMEEVKAEEANQENQRPIRCRPPLEDAIVKLTSTTKRKSSTK